MLINEMYIYTLLVCNTHNILMKLNLCLPYFLSVAVNLLFPSFILSDAPEAIKLYLKILPSLKYGSILH